MPSDPLTRADIDRTVFAEIIRRCEHRRRDAVAVSADQTFEALGLESLDLLELADALETSLHVNPFDRAFALTDVRTVGDFCRAYEQNLHAADHAGTEDPALEAGRARADARRRRQRR